MSALARLSHSIRTRLVIGFSAVVLSLGAVSTLSVSLATDIIQSVIGKSSIPLALSALEGLEKQLDSHLLRVRELTSSPLTQETLRQAKDHRASFEVTPASIREEESRWQETAPQIQRLPLSQALKDVCIETATDGSLSVFSSLEITDALGFIVAQTDYSIDAFQGDEQWWNQAKQKGIHYGNPGFDQRTETYTQSVSIRLQDPSNHFAGVVRATVNIRDFHKTIHRVLDESSYEGTSVSLIDCERRILSSTDSSTLPLSSRLAVETDALEGGHRGYFLYEPEEPDAKQRFIAYAQAMIWGKTLTAVISYDAPTILAPLYRAKNGLVTLTTLILFFTLMIGLVLSRSILAPLKGLVDAAQSWSGGRFHSQITGLERKDEIGRLARAFAMMEKRLAESYRQLEQRVTERTQELQASKQSLELEGERRRRMMAIHRWRGRSLERLAQGDHLDNVLDTIREGIVKSHPGIQCDIQVFDTALNPHDAEKKVQDSKTWRYGPILDAEGETIGLVTLSSDSLNTHEDDYADTVIETATSVASIAVERKRFEEQLERAKVKAEEANQTKSEFLANMSHELRTPLHAILSYSQLGINRSQKTQESKIHRYFKQVAYSSQILLELVNDLLDLAKLESGRIILQTTPTSCFGLCQRIAEEFQALTQERSIKVQVRGEDPALANIDPALMSQVVRNLLSNAIKFSPDGGQVEVEVTPLKDAARIEVLDQGLGIPPGELEDIFDKFIQSSTTKNGSGGTGLGLALCREITSRHQGRIWAENRVSQLDVGKVEGAKFTVEFPLNPSRESNRQPAPSLA